MFINRLPYYPKSYIAYLENSETQIKKEYHVYENIEEKTFINRLFILNFIWHQNDLTEILFRYNINII